MTEEMYRNAARDHGLQPIAFHPPAPPEGLQGCTGIARVGLCIRCDRLYISGPQIAPKAKRAGPQAVYACAEQVIGGVHVGSVATVDAAAQPTEVGGDCVNSRSFAGVSE